MTVASPSTVVSEQSITPRSMRLAPQNAFIEFLPEDLTLSVPALFERQADRYADRVAVKFHVRSLTYAHVNRAANRVAHSLVSLTGSAAAPIGVLLSDRADMVFGLLGILKAGQIGVILDPSSPSVRLNQIVQDSGLAALIVDDRTIGLAQKFKTAVGHLIRLDDLDQNVEDLRLSIPSDQPAVINYTSGSTGRPKGAVRSHHQLLRGAMRQRNLSHVGEEDRMLVLSSPSFAAWGGRVLWTLLSGAQLLLYDLKQNGLGGLAEFIRREGVTIFHSTPTVLRHFAATLQVGDSFPSVRMLSLGGDTILKKDYEIFQRWFPGECLMRVGYSATETGSISSTFLNKRSVIDSPIVPVGYISKAVEVTIVDEHDRPVGVNEVGEIVVKSEDVTLGYWRRPDLTAAAYTIDPNDDRRRAYHTGDIGRLRPDGQLEHLGRKDFQVKIRGNRVEISEIELALMDHAAVSEVFVMARNENSEGRYLAAYLVLKDHASIAGGELRGYLKDKLPDYMIPAAFVFVNSLPLNAGGKVDRAALPEPDRSSNRSDTPLAPRDDIEAALATIWQDTLRLNSIDLRADFFDLGGDSLLAGRIFAEIDRQLGKRLSPTVLLTAPTIEQLAVIVRQAEVASPPPTLVAIQPHGSKLPLFLAHGIGGGVLDYTPLARHLGSDQPVYGLVAVGLDGTERQVVDLREMAMRYVQEILAKQPSGPYALGGYSYGGAVALEIAQQLLALGQEVKVLAEFDSHAPRSNFHQLRLNRQFVFGFIKNFPFWLEQFLRLGPRGILARVRRKLRLAWWRLRKLNKDYIDISDLMDDISNISPEQREFMANQSRGLRAYQPQPYAGRVVAFRTRAQSLFCSFDPQLGWSTLAAARVEACVVAGSHHNMLQEPYVRSLAAQLKIRLD